MALIHIRMGQPTADWLGAYFTLQQLGLTFLLLFNSSTSLFQMPLLPILKPPHEYWGTWSLPLRKVYFSLHPPHCISLVSLILIGHAAQTHANPSLAIVCFLVPHLFSGKSRNKILFLDLLLRPNTGRWLVLHVRFNGFTSCSQIYELLPNRYLLFTLTTSLPSTLLTTHIFMDALNTLR